MSIQNLEETKSGKEEEVVHVNPLDREAIETAMTVGQQGKYMLPEEIARKADSLIHSGEPRFFRIRSEIESAVERLKEEVIEILAEQGVAASGISLGLPDPENSRSRGPLGGYAHTLDTKDNK